VTSFLVGSKALYDFVDDNPGIHIDEATITNTPYIIARNKKVKFCSLYKCIGCRHQFCRRSRHHRSSLRRLVRFDLTILDNGSIGTRMISGIGGQLDFEQGAAMSEGIIYITHGDSRRHPRDLLAIAGGKVKKVYNR
jgi:acyl-CoA hydrolase